MAYKEIPIISFPKGYFMFWTATTQAAFNITVTLFDDTAKYFQNSKQGTNIDPPLALGSSFINGNNLKVKIDIPSSANILTVIASNNLTTPDGKVIGYSYTIYAEDYNDMDYNDVCINLIAWAKKG